jgi:protein transport protein SEC24
MYLYIAPATADTALQELLGVETRKALPSPSQPLPLLHNPSSRLNTATHALINVARQRCRCYMRLRVITQGRAEERSFHGLILEDRVAGVMSYVEFLCHIHRRICEALRKG